MHWAEYAAIVVVALVAVPFLILFFYIGAIAWACVRAWWSPELPAQVGKRYATELASFVRDNSGWSGSIEHQGRTLTLMVSDLHGVPEQAELRDLPSIIQQLDDMDNTARNSVDELTPEMKLSSLSINRGNSAADTYETLGFSRGEGDEMETLFVDFADGMVIGWDWLH